MMSKPDPGPNFPESVPSMAGPEQAEPAQSDAVAGIGGTRPTGKATASGGTSRATDFAIALTPSLFVLLWSSGYIVAKFTIGYAEPFTILLMRFVIVAALFTGLAAATGARWPQRRIEWIHLAIVGVLLQTVYLGGIYASLQFGVPAGVSALVMALQPIMTAIAVGPMFGEPVTLRQWAGLALGFVGVALVLGDKVHFDFDGWAGIALSLLALAGITVATLYQKRFGGSGDLRTTQAVQYGAAAVATVPIVLLLGPGAIDWSLPFLFGMAWIILPLSAGTYTLFLWLIRRNAATRLTSYLYLVPPVTALIAWPMFGETMGPMALAGMAAAIGGVALVVRQ
jgi:drug/metabolite transporter (DMT)-like permease